MDTEQSIIEENQKPLPPGEAPYQRKRPKIYREGPDGLIRGQMQFEPYDLHKDTVATIAKTVWKKLKQDDELTKKVEANLMREKNIEMMKYPRGEDMYQGEPTTGRRSRKETIKTQKGKRAMDLEESPDQSFQQNKSDVSHLKK